MREWDRNRYRDECAQALDAVSSETSCTVERQMGVLYVDCVAGSAA